MNSSLMRKDFVSELTENSPILLPISWKTSSLGVELMVHPVPPCMGRPPHSPQWKLLPRSNVVFSTSASRCSTDDLQFGGSRRSD